MGKHHSENMARLTQGQAADASAPFLEELLNAQTKTVTREVFSLLDKKEALDPTLAVQRWLQLYETEKLRRAIRSTSETGRRAAIKLGPDMAIGEDDVEG